MAVKLLSPSRLWIVADWVSTMNNGKRDETNPETVHKYNLQEKQNFITKCDPKIKLTLLNLYYQTSQISQLNKY